VDVVTALNETLGEMASREAGDPRDEDSHSPASYGDGRLSGLTS
jgi:hypothetical protein